MDRNGFGHTLYLIYSPTWITVPFQVHPLIMICLKHKHKYYVTNMYIDLFVMTGLCCIPEKLHSIVLKYNVFQVRAIQNGTQDQLSALL